MTATKRNLVIESQFTVQEKKHFYFFLIVFEQSDMVKKLKCNNKLHMKMQKKSKIKKIQNGMSMMVGEKKGYCYNQKIYYPTSSKSISDSDKSVDKSLVRE